MPNHERRTALFYAQTKGSFPITSKHIERNGKCKCGSGKKSKKCCGCETEYFRIDKPNVEPIKTDTENETD